MTRMTRLVRGGAALATAAGAVAMTAPMAIAGPVLPQQRVIDAQPFVKNWGAATGNAAALLFQAGKSASSSQVYLATRDEFARPTAAKPRGFDLAVPASPTLTQLVSAKVVADRPGNTTVLWWGKDPSVTGADAGRLGVWVRTKYVTGDWSVAQYLGAQDFELNADNVYPEVVEADALGYGTAVLTDRGVFLRQTVGLQFRLLPGTENARHIAMDPAGNLAISEITRDDANPDGDNFQVRVRPAGEYSSDTETYSDPPFGAPKVFGDISTVFPQENDRSALAFTRDGTLSVAWAKDDGTDPDAGLYTSSLPPNPTPWYSTIPWTTPIKLKGGDVVNNPAIRPSTASRAIVSWYDAADPANVRRERVVPDGTATTTVPFFEAIGAAPQAGGRELGVPAAADRPAGTITARARATAGGVLEAAVPVIAPSGTAKAYSDAKVALTKTGDGYISWVRTISNGKYPDTYLLGVSVYDVNAPSVSTSFPDPDSATQAYKVGVPLTVTGYAGDAQTNVRLKWDFGDGTPIVDGWDQANLSTSSPEVTHTFATPGTYTVRAYATDEAGLTGESKKTIKVVAPEPPVRLPVQTAPTLWTPSYANHVTLVRTLELSYLRAGDKIYTYCTGAGCTPDAVKTITVTPAQVTGGKLVIPFGPTGVSLGVGATIKVVVSRTDYRSEVTTWTMQDGKAPTRFLYNAS